MKTKNNTKYVIATGLVMIMSIMSQFAYAGHTKGSKLGIVGPSNTYIHKVEKAKKKYVKCKLNHKKKR